MVFKIKKFMLSIPLNLLYKNLRNYVSSLSYINGEVILYVKSNQVKQVIFFLKDHESCLYKLLIDIVVVDYPENFYRFKIIYNLCSVKYSIRIKVITHVNETTPLLSLTQLFKNSCWLEREAWDMYGIFFENHPDLRRILTDYGFEGYPLRKDFPLSGYKEVRYDDSQKRILLEPLEMTQEFRIFTFKNPWKDIDKI
jgi:NADH/F420H2 dehydrogenase subunit C